MRTDLTLDRAADTIAPWEWVLSNGVPVFAEEWPAGWSAWAHFSSGPNGAGELLFTVTTDPGPGELSSITLEDGARVVLVVAAEDVAGFDWRWAIYAVRARGPNGEDVAIADGLAFVTPQPAEVP